MNCARSSHPARSRAAVVAVAVAVGGCQTPFDSPAQTPSFDEAIAQAVERELAGAPAPGSTLETTQPPPEAELALDERRDELDRLGPATPEARTEFDLGNDLLGGVQQTVKLDLRSAVVSAVKHNLSMRIARLEPAIGREDVVRAEAVFDWLFFANADFAYVDEPSAIPVLGGFPLGLGESLTDRYRFETGVRKKFRGGGELTLSTDLDRFNNRASGFDFIPDPAYEAALRLGFVQPLLRGFGTDVNSAEIRLAENAESRAVQDLLVELLGLVERTESAYWSLVLAWYDVEILQWLVDVGVEVRDVLDRRRDFDAKLAEYSDAVARVEQRRADVIRARRRVRVASDALKQLIHDRDLSVGSEVVLEPIDGFVEAPIRYNLREAIMTALDLRPEIERARLAVDDADLGELVTDNARLPRLDLAAGVAWFGLDSNAGRAYSNLFDGDFIDYLLGVSFEQPIGNRGPEADFRRARLVRSQSLLAYQQAVELVVLDVKVGLRDVVTSYELIRATRSARVAAAENLRALMVEEETLAGLTPEFLDLKLRRQEALAGTRRQEVAALGVFDQSVAALYRAMGTGLSMHDITLEGVLEREDDLPPERTRSRDDARSDVESSDAAAPRSEAPGSDAADFGATGVGAPTFEEAPAAAPPSHADDR